MVNNNNNNNNSTKGIEFWKQAAYMMASLLGICLAAGGGWWSRQLTLEIPPQWFRDDVKNNTRDIQTLRDKFFKI